MSGDVRPGATSAGSPVAAELAVDAAGLRKVYGPTTALAGADFQVRAGEIHGLLGENGAGKSTLVRLLAGVERPDGGELRFFGQPASGGPGMRRRAGLAFIHQDLGLFAEFSVADNIALSSGFRRRGRLISQAATNAWATENRRAHRLRLRRQEAGRRAAARRSDAGRRLPRPRRGRPAHRA